MLPIHVALLVVCDIYIYEFEILSFIINLCLIWFDFYNYMTLNKITIMGEIGLLLLTSLMALSHIQRVFLESGINIVIAMSYML